MTAAPRFPAAASAVLVVLLAGCSGTSPAASASAAPALGKIETLLWGGDHSEYWNTREMQRQELVASCMADDGFEYVPYVNAVVIQSENSDRGTRAWVEKHGFDVVNSEVQQAPPPSEPDPNDSIRAAMSQAEQETYETALFGPPLSELVDDADPVSGWGIDKADNGEALVTYTNLDGEEVTATLPWDSFGCLSIADEELIDKVGPSPWDDPAYDGLREEIDAFWQTEHSDPEWVALDTEWSECLAGKGHAGYENPTQARTSFEDRLPSSYSLDDPTVKALGDEEIQVALADFDCRAELDYDTRSKAIDVRLQKEFYDAHHAELDAYVAAMDGA